MPVLRWLSRDEDIKTASKAAYRLLAEQPELGASGGGGGAKKKPKI
ncbi:MAG: hypothetical protein LBU73_07490 [Helicobacteraceae bacterium]|jgi:hypothetical protein|nr:hypothetical protein [Helicobacteraceae bacterium]